MKLFCTSCNEIKDSDEFHKWNSNKRGFKYHCKVCRKGEDIDKKREHYYDNKEKYHDNNRKWKESNKSLWNKYMKEYRTNNPEYRNKALGAASTAKRRTSVKNQTPSWSDLKKIEQIYKVSEKLSKDNNITFHVDHIMPINKGGLHVWWNLRIVPHYINESKSDKVFEENIISPRVSDNSLESYLNELKIYAELALNEA